jgi:proline iminopeptidase
MPQIMEIELPQRGDISKTTLYVKAYLQNKFNDRDVMIMLPGGPGNDHSLYDTIAENLFPFVDIVLFDPRGCGNSQSSEVKYCSLDHYIDDVEALRSQLKITPNKFIVFGQSYGSIAALGYCIRYPNNMKKLLLIGGAVSSEFMKEAKANIHFRGTIEQQKMAEKIWAGSFKDENDLTEFYRVMGSLYSSTFDPDEPVPPISSNIDILNYGWGNFLKKFDFRNELEKIKCKSLILWGDEEIFFSKNQIDFLVRHIKRCDLIIFPKCGHLLWIDNWEGFIKSAIDFINSK